MRLAASYIVEGEKLQGSLFEALRRRVFAVN